MKKSKYSDGQGSVQNLSHLWMPRLCKRFVDQFGHVIGRGHLSGLFVWRYSCHGPVWRYAVRSQNTFPGLSPRAKDWLFRTGSCRSFVLTARRPPHIPDAPVVVASIQWLSHLCSDGHWISIVLLLHGHGPQSACHAVRERNGHDHPWLRLHHPLEP